MKKFLVAILAFTYLSTATGATVHLHYCMGKLVSWALWHNDKESKNCSKCGMNKAAKNGCCKDEHKIIKIDKDQKLSESSFKTFQLIDAVQPLFTGVTHIFIPTISEENPVSNAPPESKQVAIYIRNCVFRI